jgi:hypothetical protein
MTKSETREVQKIIVYGKTLGADYVARGLSALYRAARTAKTQREIFELADDHGLTSNPEFIIK